MTTSQQELHETTLPEHARTPHGAGALRVRLREAGWSSDLSWVEVGARTAISAARAAGGEARRTIAYLPSLSAVDGGTRRLWKEGDVPVPSVADVREVMLATETCEDWISELFEAPPERVETEEALAGVAA